MPIELALADAVDAAGLGFALDVAVFKEDVIDSIASMRVKVN